MAFDGAPYRAVVDRWWKAAQIVPCENVSKCGAPVLLIWSPTPFKYGTPSETLVEAQVGDGD